MAKKEKLIQKRIRVTFDIVVECEPGSVLNQDDLVDGFIDLFSKMQDDVEVDDILLTEEFAGEIASIELKNLSIVRRR